MFTDKYPEEIAWTIKKKSGPNIRQFSKYKTPLTWYSYPECLSSGQYEFIITDTYGDGICCDYGLGEYAIRVGGKPTHISGGNYRKSETVPFNI